MKSSETTVAGALLAAIAMTVSGCSGDGGIVMGFSPSVAGKDVEDAPFEVVTAETNQPETVSTTPAASSGPTAQARGQTQASPRGGNSAAAAPSVSAPAAAPEAEPTEEVAAEPSPAPVPSDTHLDTMHTSGRQLLDTCGKPFVTRGVEQIFGEQLPQGNDWVGLIEEIAKSGVNAVRVLAGTDTLTTQDVDQLLGVIAENGLVAYVTPYGNEAMQWLEAEDVRAMLAKHEKYILIDAFGEPTFDDRERFINDSIDAIQTVRSWGYRVPLTVTANQFGRDLPSLFEFGAEIIAADPLHNTVLGWQAYWSQNGYYQGHYGMSLSEAVDAVSRSPYPIQLGLDRVTDFPASDTADYGTLMSATAKHGVGWLWWDWYNPYGNENNLTENGSAAQLTSTGRSVVETHPASVQNTAQLVCVR